MRCESRYTFPNSNLYNFMVIEYKEVGTEHSYLDFANFDNMAENLMFLFYFNYFSFNIFLVGLET